MRTTYVFAGGGTGGHLFPGIAVAEELIRADRSVRIVFAGSERTLEQEILRQYGMEHRPLSAEPSTVLRSRPFRFIWRNYQAYRQVRRELHVTRPAAVIGLGGYASIPVVLAAAALDIPRLLLEQNVVPGRATRWLLRKASWTCFSFDETADECPSGVGYSVCGNPVRREIAELSADSSGREESPVLLVLGGSQGAMALNDLVLEAIEQLGPRWPQWKVVHQTGQPQVEKVRSRYAELGIDAIVEPFFETLTGWYRSATLAVSRAGGTTLAELACAGVPAVLVPYPHSIGNHQLRNAMYFQRHGAAHVLEQIPDPSAAGDRLASVLDRLVAATDERNRMRESMRSLARPNAARDVAAQLCQLVGSRAACA